MADYHRVERQSNVHSGECLRNSEYYNQEFLVRLKKIEKGIKATCRLHNFIQTYENISGGAVDADSHQ